MKNQKRIIEHLIQQSKTNAQIKKKVQYENAQQLEISRPTLQFDTIYSNTEDRQNISVELQPAFNFQVFIQIGDGRSDCIIMTEKSDPLHEADKFCAKYNLEKYIVDLLAQSLTQQAKKQRNKMTKSSLSSVNSFNVNKKILDQQKNSEHRGLYKQSKNSQQLWRESEESFTNQPRINQVSDQIVRKIGKNNIIESNSRKFYQKAQQIIIDQIQNEEKEFQSFPFHPSINPISRQVDQTLVHSKNSRECLSRYEHLYEQHKLIQSKKEVKRRNSVMQIPFKPSINQLSRIIMEKKRSLGELHPLSAGKERPKSSQKYQVQRSQSNKKLVAKKNKSLNSSSANLCNHLYEQAKKRQQKIQKQSNRIYGNQNNWKIIQNSNSLVNNLREARIRQIFIRLSQPPHKTLHYLEIDEKKLNNVQKIFLPVFQEMKQIDTDLTEEQFIHAGMRLLKYVSPNQRAILIRKNSHILSDKQNAEKVIKVNKKSKQILKERGYGQNDIYMRGLVYKNQKKNQIEKGKEQKVRKQLRSCTFKPKINGVPQNIGY